jgi:hypothetical protein
MKTLLTIALMVFVSLDLHAQAPAQQDLQQRVQALEEKVQALEAELAAIRAAVGRGVTPAPESPATPAPQTPAALAAAPTGGDQPAPTQLPIYGGTTAAKVFDPDIGMIRNFIGATGESRGESESVAPFSSFTLQESEASFQAIVDPFARADFFLAIGEDG